jgi:hypothetical protein
MSVLYMHFRQKKPIAEAMRQLDFFTFGHIHGPRTGVLDYMFERYVRDIEPLGVSFEDWVRSPAYDSVSLTKEFRAQWWGKLLSRILRRG